AATDRQPGETSCVKWYPDRVAVRDIVRQGALCCLLMGGCHSEASLARDLGAARDLALRDFAAAPVPDGGVVLAPPGDTAQSQSVDGITCNTSEQLLFHIPPHLQMYVNGEDRLVAAGGGFGPPL